MILLPGHDAVDGYVQMRSGLILPEHVAREHLQVPDFSPGVDIFCGCGGFSLGAIQAGFTIVAAAEWDPASAVTYMSNLCRYGKFGLHFVEQSDQERLNRYLEKAYVKSGLIDRDGELVKKRSLRLRGSEMAGSGWIRHQPASVIGCTNFFFGDVTKLTGARILNTIGMDRGDVMCVFGGPPCQGFSTSGKRKIEDPRNNLVFEFIRLVLEIHPQTMCMENVPGIQTMTTPDGLPIIDAVCAALESGSFSSVEMLRKAIALQAGNVGVINRSARKKKPLKAKYKRPTETKPKTPPIETIDWRDVRAAVPAKEAA